MQRVLITGGAGFIGSSLTNALLHSKKNYHVTVLDNLSRGRLENISQLLELSSFEFVNRDLLDFSNPNGQKASVLQKIVDRSDIIFHLAANADVAIGIEDTRIDFQQNVLATYYLLESVRRSQQAIGYGKIRNKKRLIFTSSSTVYGKASKRPTHENYSPLCPISLYGSTKLASEAIISGYCHMFGISCVVARLANIIGPTNTHGVIYDFIRKLTAHPDFLDVLGNGQQDKSYLYIDDCVSALMLLSEWIQKNSGGANETNGNFNKQQRSVTLSNSAASETGRRYVKEGYESQFHVFNIGSDDTITVLRIAQIVMEQLSLGSKKVKIVFKDNFVDGSGWKGDVPDFWLDCSKLKDIGWKPKYGRSENAVLRACKEHVRQEKGSQTSVV